MNFSKKNLFQDWEDGFSLKCFACVSPEWTYQFSQLKVIEFKSVVEYYKVEDKRKAEEVGDRFKKIDN